MEIKYPKIFHCNTFQNLPIFWFENITSGNPGPRPPFYKKALRICSNLIEDDNWQKFLKLGYPKNASV
jgi:hypothetical protein